MVFSELFEAVVAFFRSAKQEAHDAGPSAGLTTTCSAPEVLPPQKQEGLQTSDTNRSNKIFVEEVDDLTTRLLDLHLHSLWQHKHFDQIAAANYTDSDAASYRSHVSMKQFGFERSDFEHEYFAVGCSDGNLNEAAATHYISSHADPLNSCEAFSAPPSPSGFVNPWEIDVDPNPVIFKHYGKLAAEDAFAIYHSNESGVGVPDIDSLTYSQMQETATTDHVSVNGEMEHAAVLTQKIRPPEIPRPESESMISTPAELISPSSRSPPTTDDTTPTTSISLSEQVSTNVPGLHCVLCDISFERRGPFNIHVNRKHNRRYECDLCTKKFHLPSDLKKHEKGVHKVGIDMTASSGMKCTNALCTTPDKIWPREDNLKRHILRCSKTYVRPSRDCKVST